MSELLSHIATTEEIRISQDPFERIIGQEHAVMLVRSAVLQRRHVLLCGEPGIGKSMLAKAASTLLSPAREEIRVRANPVAPNRPEVVIRTLVEDVDRDDQYPEDVFYIRPEELPYDVAVEMGYRCPHCGSLSLPEQGVCIDCGSAKRCDWKEENSYHGLFRALNLIHERAETTVTRVDKQADGTDTLVIYQRDKFDTIKVISRTTTQSEAVTEAYDEFTIVPRSASRFIRVSGASAVELLGDVRHDPYGSADGLGVPPHQRVVPGAIHEAHEGILYIDEIATLGPLQKHLLTAMQDKRYPITGHNPHSSGASVRVDDVPCDFILIASTNLEDLPGILPPLRSRIRGYGYEILLSSWTKKTHDAVDQLVRFVAQTVQEDRKIPHFTAEAVGEIVSISERMALKLDGQPDSLTLRLRELGGVIRIAGDLAVQDGAELVCPEHVKRAEELAFRSEIEKLSKGQGHLADAHDYGSYFL